MSRPNLILAGPPAPPGNAHPDPLTGLPGLPPALLLPVLVLLGVLMLALWWSSMRTRSGMAQRAAVRQTLGRPALQRAAAELRPSLQNRSDDEGAR